MIDVEGEGLGAIGGSALHSVVVVARWTRNAPLSFEVEVVGDEAGNAGSSIPKRGFCAAYADSILGLISAPIAVLVANLLATVGNLAEVCASWAVHTLFGTDVVVGSLVPTALATSTDHEWGLFGTCAGRS